MCSEIEMQVWTFGNLKDGEIQLVVSALGHKVDDDNQRRVGIITKVTSKYYSSTCCRNTSALSIEHSHRQDEQVVKNRTVEQAAWFYVCIEPVLNRSNQARKCSIWHWQLGVVRQRR